jgi:CTP synthase
LRNDLGDENVFYILVAPLLYVKCSGEFKTKPIQHAYKELTRL